MRLDDFFGDPRISAAGTASLTILHIAALRLYSTAAYKYINDPLRDMGPWAGRRESGKPHPLPLIVTLIAEATSKYLVAAEAKSEDSCAPMDLYRGMRKMQIDGDFLVAGGCEFAPMSTTTDLTVAMKYSLGRESLLLRIATRDYQQRGIPIKWLSAFPAEEEILYPPLTRLKATGKQETFSAGEGAQKWTVVTVEPMV